MKPRISELLASLIVDEWPLPRGCKRWLESKPSVADAIRRSRRIESMMRGEPVAVDSDPFAVAAEPFVSRSSPLPVVAVSVLAIAAAILLVVGVEIYRSRSADSVDGSLVVAESFDLQPVIATAAAGKTVVDGVSMGLRNVATDLVGAGQSISSNFDFGLARSRQGDDSRGE